MLTPLERPKPIHGLCKLENKLVVFDLDTGADISAISKTVYESLNPQPRLLKNYPVVLSAGGKMDNVLGLVRVKVKIGTEQFSSYLLVVDDLPVDCLLGRDLFPYSKILRALSREMQRTIQIASKYLVSHDLKREENSTQAPRNLKLCKQVSSLVQKNSILESKRYLFTNQIKSSDEEITLIKQTRETIQSKLSRIAANNLSDLGGNIESRRTRYQVD